MNQDESEPEHLPTPFSIHGILTKCISHKDNEEPIAMMVSSLQDRGVNDIMEFQNTSKLGEHFPNQTLIS